MVNCTQSKHTKHLKIAERVSLGVSQRPTQNPRHKVVNRGGYTFVRRGFMFMQGGWHSNLTKFPPIYSVSYFNLAGLGALFGGTKPTKSSLWRRDRSHHVSTPVCTNGVWPPIRTVWRRRVNRRRCSPLISNPSTSSWLARCDGSGRWDNRMAAQHLPRDLARPSSGQQQFALTTKNQHYLHVTNNM